MSLADSARGTRTRLQPPRARGTRSFVLVLVALVVLAGAGWLTARQIKSPAQIAADAAPPPASAITVPVERRVLSTKVIVRGTARFGGRSSVELGTSQLKQGSGIVTDAPRRRATLRPGSSAMTVDTRPVFTLPGRIPMSRDLVNGARGADVLQFERALGALGVSPGPIDGVFDRTSQAAVATLYTDRGYEPFGATDAQLERLTAAQDAAAAARQAHLQALDTLQQARRGAPPGEHEQAQVDAAAAVGVLHEARLAVPTAEARVRTARAAARTGAGLERAVAADLARDQAAADADVALKQEAVTTAVEEERLATLQRDSLPLDSPPSEREAANAAVARAHDATLRARAELVAATAAAGALRANAPRSIRAARDEAASLRRDATVAVAELRRAERGVAAAERQVRFARLRARALARPSDTAAMNELVGATAADADRTRALADRLAARTGIAVPADEVLFLPNLPVQVEDVRAPRGSTVSGSVMTVTGDRVVVDSSLSSSDLRLVHTGDHVVVDDQDRGIEIGGEVLELDTRPGTHRVDPSRFYLAVGVRGRVAASLVGASVRLTIAVRSTRGKVLAVPVSAVSVGGDGSSRVQVRRGQRTVTVPVVPGLAAEGYVEVRPTAGGRLEPGDLVVVGERSARGGPRP